MQQFQMLFPGGKAKALTLSYDDGVEQDLHLIELMKQHGVKGTFNLNSSLFAPEGTVYPAGQIHRRMSCAQCREAYDNEYCEVALHGATHSFLQAQPTALAMHEIITDRRQMEEMYGRTIRGMAYPYGTYSDSVVDILRLAGVAYCRTTQSHLNFRLPEDYLRWGATCHHKNAALMDLCDAFLGDVPRNEYPRLFYLWGHSYEFEADGNWQVMEQFLQKMGGREEIWYATNIEIYDAHQAFNRLIFSANGKLVTNPSYYPVWARCDGETIQIPGGATVRL